MHLRFLFCIFCILMAISCSSDAEPRAAIHRAAQPKPEQNRGAGKDKKAQRGDRLKTFIGQMSLKHKVAQLMFVDIRGPKGGHSPKTWSRELEQFAKKYPFGGLILFRNNLKSAAQLQTLLQDLRASAAFSKIKPFVAIDEEGGAISRLKGLPGLDYEGIESAYRLAHPRSSAAVSAEQARKLARERGQFLGRLLAELGIQVNMAPIADLYLNKQGSWRSAGPIGTRAFSADPLQAGQMVAAFVSGLQQQGIAAVLKHFPGHGYVEGDPHNGASIYYGDLTAWQKEGHSLPFAAGIEAGAHFVMLGHFQLPKILSDDTPASLSQFVIQDMLRQDLNFDGLIISDSFDMHAIKDHWDSAQASVRFLLAGGDMPLMPPSPAEAVQGILQAIENGQLTEQRIDESLLRILQQKQSMGLLTSNFAEQGAAAAVPETSNKL